MPRKKPATTTDLPIRNPPPTPNNTPNNSPMPSPTPIPELALWQAKTLKPTHPKRTPLPNAPHSRPWIGLKAADLKRAVNRSFAKARKEKKAEAEEKRNRSVKVHGPRRVWLREEIEKLADMRENGATWAELQEVFPWRSDEGLKQVWWKHKYRRNKIEHQKRDSSMSSEMDMDIDRESFSKDGKVRWNFKRKSS